MSLNKKAATKLKDVSQTKIESPVAKRKTLKKSDSKSEETTSLLAFFSPKAKPSDKKIINIPEDPEDVVVPEKNEVRPGLALEESDTGLKKLVDHVNNRNEWMRKFNEGKKAHPFFARAKAQAEAQALKKDVPIKIDCTRNTKPTEAPFPGPMFYSLAIRFTASSSIASDSIRSTPLSRSPREPRNDWQIKKQLVSKPLLTAVRSDKYIFPCCTLFWFSLFGKINSQESPSIIDFDSKSFRDFFPLSFNTPEDGVIVQQGDWLKRYGATSSRQFLGNQDQLIEIKKWLEGWKLIACSTSNDSEDELICNLPVSDDSDYGSLKKRKKRKDLKANTGTKHRRRKAKSRLAPITILQGSPGVGKTAAVYACANDCGYRVLEINASAARSSTEIVKLVGELATSHLVNSRTSFFQTRRSTPTTNQPPPNLLILIDEVDILFQGEKGLFNTLNQLAAETRRPFILTSNRTMNSDVSHSLIHTEIKLRPAPTINLVNFLQLMCLQEGSVLPQPLATFLVEHYNGDFRKLILELEMLSRKSKQIETSSCISSLETVKRLFPGALLEPNLKSEIEAASTDDTKYLTVIKSQLFLEPQDLQAGLNHEESIDVLTNGAEGDDFEAYVKTLESFSWLELFDSSVSERIELNSPETCLKTPRILDIDEFGISKEDKFHQCPNRMLGALNEFAPKASRKATLPSTIHRLKSSYRSEILSTLPHDESKSYDYLDTVKESTSKTKISINEAMSRARPRFLVSSECPYDILPYLAKQLGIESQTRSRLRSRRVMTSLRFQHTNSEDLKTICSVGIFDQLVESPPASPEPLIHPIEQFEPSSDDFMS